MRPVVALLKARPETIADDYGRLLGLLDFGAQEGTEDFLLATEARQRSWFPGLVCPPWQVAGVLESLNGSHEMRTPKSTIIPVTDSGPIPRKSGQKWGWEETLALQSMATMAAGDLEPVSYRPESLMPALEGVLPRGLNISPHLRGKNLVLLSSMGLELGGGLKANLALLDSFLASGRKSSARIPEAEILAEVVGLARELFSSLLVVTDATIWSLARRGGTRVPLVRNILVAGNDPVAVDAVLAKMAGINPVNLPWLRLCEGRGLGVADLSKISIVGEPECLDLDFRIPEDTFASGNPVFGLSPGALWSRMMGRGKTVANRIGNGAGKVPADSAWVKLFRQYESGVIS